MATSTINRGIVKHVVSVPNSVTIAPGTSEVVVDLGETSNANDTNFVISAVTNSQGMTAFILFVVFYANHTYIKAFNTSSTEKTIVADDNINYYTF